MALEDLFVLLVIVRVEGPTPAGGAYGAVPTGGGIAPWTIGCRIPATRSPAWRCSPAWSRKCGNG
ncbi:hypothetical protein GCM10010172_59420 [Paractinoplanes ferrugineus]|uniref:Uncharacterized protein n=1 Tax=Paractinoplanes ferrugineus TaxID=113564 RepID=A0A919MH00_9ACTN|nr:hypothetical protein Afe05nite_62440 [Actinoplanes ferrugineus]